MVGMTGEEGQQLVQDAALDSGSEAHDVLLPES